MDNDGASRIGTAVVTRPDGRLAVGRLGSLFEQLQELNSQGYEVILVSSGAIGVGCQCLRYRKLLNSRHTCALCAMKEVNIIPEDEKSIESLKQLQQEIWFLSQYQHPNIVQYYGSEILVEKDLNRAIVLFSSHLYRSDISGVSWSSTYSIRAFFRSLLACQRVGTFSQEVSEWTLYEQVAVAAMDCQNIDVAKQAHVEKWKFMTSLDVVPCPSKEDLR
ncbi:pyrroline-5-carboxylate synthetase [Carex littledalei]|uniref:Pyrroline-5-carboxylate synthetase n=1 Tax=Carex littledalei TaxID=544730 RepID=A0A833RRM1_9POAL|nr:pyrroline-5-carboxylate synthetase [Carex littledalei]